MVSQKALRQTPQEQTPLGTDTPQKQTPPGRRHRAPRSRHPHPTPWEQTPPRSRLPQEQTPPGSRHPPRKQTPQPPEQTPPRADTPQSRHPPPPEQTPLGSRLQHTVYEWPVRILLECVLVDHYLSVITIVDGLQNSLTTIQVNELRSCGLFSLDLC